VHVATGAKRTLDECEHGRLRKKCPRYNVDVRA